MNHVLRPDDPSDIRDRLAAAYAAGEAQAEAENEKTLVFIKAELEAACDRAYRMGYSDGLTRAVSKAN